MADGRSDNRLTRREFLRTAALAGGGALVAVACGPEVARPPGTAPTPTEPTAAPTEAAAEITYVFHDPAEFRAEAMAAFSEQFPNIKVELQQVPDDFPTAILTMAAAGTLPDVARVWEPHVLEFARAGQVIDLQPFIDAEPDFNREDFLEVFYDFSVIDGAQYGIADGWNGHQTFFNTDMFDEAGIDPPSEGWTWDDYVGLARQLSSPEEQRWGSDTIPVGWLHWNYKLIWQNGGQVYNPGYTECLLDSPEAAEGIQFWADLLNEGEIMPSPAQAEGMGDLFLTGRVAMQRMGSWAIASLAEGDFSWNMVSEPQSRDLRTLIHTAFNVIPTTTENQDAAWSWLNFMVGPEGMFLYVRDNATPGTRRSVNERQPWVREGIEANWEVVVQTAEHGVIVPAPPNVGEVERIQTDALERIYLAGEKAADVFSEIAPMVTEALQVGA